MRYAALTVATWLAISGSAVAQDKAAIQKLTDQLTTGLNSGDAAAVAAIYSEDAYLLPPNSAMVQSREKIQEFWAADMPSFEQAKLTTENVKPLGENAVRELGSFTVKTKGDEPQARSGKYVIIWEKTGDEWLIESDIWNFDG